MRWHKSSYVSHVSKRSTSDVFSLLATFFRFTLKYLSRFAIRPPQDVDVLAVLDFQIPYSRPEPPNFYPRCLLTKHAYKHKGHEQKTRKSATTIRTGTRDSKIQESWIRMSRSPVCDNLCQRKLCLYSRY